ncbi:MAG: DEAD-box ATP-dependent RNA helicase CshA [Candidatus Dependentiae bacterium ADurb.Bin331]|nr:MAG: DEAD-box ATP-dependent RNA helicase CshA [Candidatus Dependentiae bacterium ADurb.Bin331]
MNKSFNDFELHSQLKQAIAGLGYTEPTPIQAQTLPVLLANARTHFHGQAQTGTGKTLAFGLPLLQHIDPAIKKVQGLVIAPTRELAVQIEQSLTSLARSLGIFVVPIYGGVPIEKQMRDLRNGAHIVVGTPGRLNDHIKRKTLRLDGTKIVILDEADIMLDMGFKEEVDELINATAYDRSLWLFSATVKSCINDLMKSHMPNPVSVRVNATSVASDNTKQYYAIANRRQRFEVLCRIIESVEDLYGFVFCQTKMMTAEVAQMLEKRGYKAQALNGDMSQARRNQVIKSFKNKEFNLLIATDVAARGLDVPDITHVINYGLPEDQESYIHRIGRTGRAGKQGVAITLVDPYQQFRLNSLSRRYRISIDPISLPTAEEMMQKQVRKAQESLEQLSKQSFNRSHEQELAKIINQLSHEELVRALVACTSKLFMNVSTEEFSQESFSAAQRGEEGRRQQGGNRPRGRSRFFSRRR